MLYLLLVTGAIVCAFFAIRARHLLAAAIWLAGVSALVSIILYNLGAHQVAVVELSVGAGLVTVLFVFAISIAGEEGLRERAFVPNYVALGLAALFVGLLAWMLLPLDVPGFSKAEATFSDVLWGDRALDMLAQIVLIFTGVLCLVGLLVDRPASEAQDESRAAHAARFSGNAHSREQTGDPARDIEVSEPEEVQG
jgi:uncharacterized MnhB-related membrane protein